MSEPLLCNSFAVKGSGPDAPIRGTKTGRGKRLPVSEPLRDWITIHVDPSGRLKGKPLFVNSRTGKRWSHWALREVWTRAARAAGFADPPRLYEGTKHTFATAAIQRDVPERKLQRSLGHKDLRSTRRYARLADRARSGSAAARRPVHGLSTGPKRRS